MHYTSQYNAVNIIKIVNVLLYRIALAGPKQGLTRPIVEAVQGKSKNFSYQYFVTNKKALLMYYLRGKAYKIHNLLEKYGTLQTVERTDGVMGVFLARGLDAPAFLTGVRCSRCFDRCRVVIDVQCC
jgi:hypothetical protein